ncbi:MAG: sulfatase [Planctomycetota bacterium]|nr:sulfatase [Planctomycetota bacterium]
MRILYIDMDSCRPDHLGCYGYHRNTSPNIDRIAKDAAVFANCYASDTPCLPSRTALLTGQFGFKTGVVTHHGEASFPREPRMGAPAGAPHAALPAALLGAGFHTAFISPFIQRHNAWHTVAGFLEVHDTGKRGHEIASETNGAALPWLERRAREDNWFVHLNYWDPHRPYRTPIEYGNPFKDDPAPAWPDAETLERHYRSYGPRSASEPQGYRWQKGKDWPREKTELRTPADFKHWIDGYDTGIRYMDDHIGQILETLDRQGVLEETAIVLSADHGEMQGELNVYGDHHCADEATAHVPLIVKWPGVSKPGRHGGLCYNLDLTATIADLAGAKQPARWDGLSFASAVRGQPWQGREYLVLGQGLWTCQRSVRTENWLMIRTFHPGLKPLPEVLLFDVEKDPHQTRDLAVERPEAVNRCGHLMLDWTAKLLAQPHPIHDPLNVVIHEGGPCATRGQRDRYVQYLKERGMPEAAEEVLRLNPV